MTQRKFLPVLSMDWFGLLKKAKKIEGDFGILAPLSDCTSNFLMAAREMQKPFFIDRGIFKEAKRIAWHEEQCANFHGDRWIHTKELMSEERLLQKILKFLDNCEKFSPDYVFAPDVFQEPLISLYLAKLAWELYSTKARSFSLIGIVQVGSVLHEWRNKYPIPQVDALLPHYNLPRSFLSSLISEYRRIGYKCIALGGLLQPDSTRSTGLKFGISNKEFDSLLQWSRPDFVLGGLSLNRLEILKRHNVWADSTNWLWWDEKYDYDRFKGRDVVQEVVNIANAHKLQTEPQVLEDVEITPVNSHKTL